MVAGGRLVARGISKMAVAMAKSIAPFSALTRANAGGIATAGTDGADARASKRRTILRGGASTLRARRERVLKARG